MPLTSILTSSSLSELVLCGRQTACMYLITLGNHQEHCIWQHGDGVGGLAYAGHTQASVRGLLPRLHYFQEGTCIVHHIFGGRVTELVAAAYSDAFLTAHFEVHLLPSPHIPAPPLTCLLL